MSYKDTYIDSTKYIDKLERTILKLTQTLNSADQIHTFCGITLVESQEILELKSKLQERIYSEEFYRKRGF